MRPGATTDTRTRGCSHKRPGKSMRVRVNPPLPLPPPTLSHCRVNHRVPTGLRFRVNPLPPPTPSHCRVNHRVPTGLRFRVNPLPPPTPSHWRVNHRVPTMRVNPHAMVCQEGSLHRSLIFLRRGYWGVRALVVVIRPHINFGSCAAGCRWLFCRAVSRPVACVGGRRGLTHACGSG